MNVSRRWLEEFLRRPLDARELERTLAMLGAPVDAVEPLNPGLDEILVGVVDEVRPHPNADRLRVCLVDDGSGERRNVVCGAPNVAAGRKYPFAPVGATVPHGKGGAPMRIERAKLRGEPSEGMLCSARELGLGEDHAGLWELATDAAPGTRLVDAVPLSDDRLVVDVTPNRPDLLGHKGVARELGARLGAPIRLPGIPGSSGIDLPPVTRMEREGRTGGVRVSIDDPEGCRRFVGVVIRGVRVGPSPTWLARRLEAVGVRSINNVVDATNYVMLELNRPMHAYDLATLRGPAIIARRARRGETVVTLDDVERSLDPDMVVIADDGGVIGVGGVMGGATTEVSERTTDIFLECAHFEPARLRRTRRALGLSTEASYRFERGVDQWANVEGVRRCVEIVLATGGGEVAEAPVDVWPAAPNPPRIFLRLDRVATVLGVPLSQHEVERCLVAIGATVVAKPEDGRLAVDVPGWRPDLRAEIDLIEEVARIHGYDEFPTELRPFRVGDVSLPPDERLARDVRHRLAGLGLYEVGTLPMGPADGSAAVRLLNPLSSTDGYLRARLVPGLARQVELNWSMHTRDVRLYELGTVFTANAGGRPVERRVAAGVLTGRRDPAHWTDAERHDFDLWDAKGFFEAALGLANPSATIQVEDAAWVARGPDGRLVGWAGPIAADAPPWAAPLFGFEIELDIAPRAPRAFAGLATTPAVERVLALVVPDGLTVARIEASLLGRREALLEAVGIESEFRGGDLPPRTRSVAMRLRFRATDRTLRDEEVDAAEARLLDGLDRDLGVRRRDAASRTQG